MFKGLLLTGRPGVGKTTLERRGGEQLDWPAASTPVSCAKAAGGPASRPLEVRLSRN